MCKINREGGTDEEGDFFFFKSAVMDRNCALLSMLHVREEETVEKQDNAVSLI